MKYMNKHELHFMKASDLISTDLTIEGLSLGRWRVTKDSEALEPAAVERPSPPPSQ
jgi:hypothetical protein